MVRSYPTFTGIPYDCRTDCICCFIFHDNKPWEIFRKNLRKNQLQKTGCFRSSVRNNYGFFVHRFHWYSDSASGCVHWFNCTLFWCQKKSRYGRVAAACDYQDAGVKKMGRTVYYNMEGRTAKKEKKKIMKMEKKYNKNYRWRGEKLSLSRGFTKTYDSDKDACRVIMAIIEISMDVDRVWRIQDDENMMDGKIKKGVFTGKIDLKKWMKCGECFNVPAMRRKSAKHFS